MKSAIVLAVAASLIGAVSAEAKSNRRPAGALKSRTATQATAPSLFAMAGGGLVGVARFYVGGNPTDMNRAWCGRFVRMVIRRATGNDPGPAFDAAANFARLGRPGRAGEGAIVYWGHHVGIIARLTGHGRAIVISGNDGPAGGRMVMERERSLAGARFRYL